MTRAETLLHEFVEHIPETLVDGVLYISIPFATVIHRCCCGCGSEVVTPLSPTDWRLTFDGESISLHPSIGNWSFACQSHYWIRQNTVQWARRWSKEEIAAGRAADQRRKRRQFGEKLVDPENSPAPDFRSLNDRTSLWRFLPRWAHYVLIGRLGEKNKRP